MSEAKSILEYKGYMGSIQADLDDGVLYGTVYGINDVVHYEADDVKGLEAAFRGSVDEYLLICDEKGKPPDKPYSGKFQTRVGEDLHRQAAAKAAAEGVSLNDFVARAIKRQVG
jgi:predicted HicB family RNase H-like nuclease